MWVKRWPNDHAVLALFPLDAGETFSTVNEVYYPLAQQSCGGDIGSVPYVCM